MNIAQAKQQVKDTVEAYLAQDDAGLPLIPVDQQRPLFLIGAPGIGKTAIMRQVADELGIGLVAYSMTHHTRQSALGLPYIVEEDFEGFRYSASEYTMSEIIAAIYDYMRATGKRQGILFLDEINCVSETLYPSMLQFLQQKSFGRHRVPQGWIVACAGNPPEYNRSVHEFDVVILDRLRRLSVEPDYRAWRDYALDRGVHPAVLSFLEIKKDCFFKVETSMTGKSFVTARAWDDLSAMIKLFEHLDKEVDAALISQFLQDEEICDRFAAYYQLFEKYRSDYRVDAILAGQADAQIVDRARQSKFDERVALIGLLSDALTGALHDACEQKDVLMGVRDTLREAKQTILEGGSAVVALGASMTARDERLQVLEDSGTASPEALRRVRLETALLRDLRVSVQAAGAESGQGAFEVIETGFKKRVTAFEDAVEAGKSMIDNAFAFVDEAFGQRNEAVIFVTELTSRRACSRFVGEFGSDSYYAHNDSLLVDEHREDIKRRMEDLGL